jgi:hypothetical protein
MSERDRISVKTASRVALLAAGRCWPGATSGLFPFAGPPWRTVQRRALNLPARATSGLARGGRLPAYRPLSAPHSRQYQRISGKLNLGRIHNR